MREKIKDGPHPADAMGKHIIYRFDNGYGASVVRFYGSYGYEQGLWELAVIKFEGEKNDFKLCYDTPITDDVIGYLTMPKVDELLDLIEALPKEVN